MITSIPLPSLPSCLRGTYPSALGGWIAGRSLLADRLIGHVGNTGAINKYTSST